jgi:hypothetical protein
VWLLAVAEVVLNDLEGTCRPESVNKSMMDRQDRLLRTARVLRNEPAGTGSAFVTRVPMKVLVG